MWDGSKSRRLRIPVELGLEPWHNGGEKCVSAIQGSITLTGSPTPSPAVGSEVVSRPRPQTSGLTRPRYPRRGLPDVPESEISSERLTSRLTSRGRPPGPVRGGGPSEAPEGDDSGNVPRRPTGPTPARKVPPDWGWGGWGSTHHGPRGRSL